MDMIGTALVWVSAIAATLLLLRAWLAWRWHRRGVGECTAHAEYARIRRDRPDTAEARLTEAEFVRYRVSMRPGAVRYVIAALLLLLIGLPAAFALMRGWPWD